MGRNEIRLRRQKISSGRIAQHRNYTQLMQRHERDVRLRRITRTVVYFLIILAMLIIFVIVKRWENRQERDKQTSLVTTITTSIILIPKQSGSDKSVITSEY